jgi:peptide/nickel transport system substrate-binding protein
VQRKFGWCLAAVVTALLVGSAAGLGGPALAHARLSPHAGGTLGIEIPNDPPGLDPATVLDNDAGYVMATLYDGLTAYKPGTTQVIPGLATSWRVTNGGTSYVFNLRQGVRFCDGTAFDANAVAGWLDYLTNPKNPNYYANRKGISTFVPFTFGTVTGYKVLGPYRIEIDLKSPNGEFLADLAMVWNGVSSPAAIRKWGANYYLHPCGTGPFTLASWVRGQYVKVVANPHYWGGKPYLNSIVFQVIPDPASELLALKTGTVQILTDVMPNEVATIKSTPTLRLVAEPGLTISGISLPTQVKPFNDVRVRQALNYAVDKAAIDKNLFFGLASVMNSPLPPASFGYDPKIPAYPYNPAKAKALLKAAGYPHGFTATLLTYTGPRSYNPIGGPELATAVQADLAKVGVELKIDQVDPATWLSEARSPSFKEMTLVGWSGDNGDPDDMISPLFNGNAFTVGNFAHYNNATVNRLFAEALATSDQATRAQLYDRIQRQIMQDAPWIFINSVDLLRGESTRVHGFVPNPTFFYFNMNKVWLSP